jgi:predicted nucleic acid-binding protein
LIVFDASIVVSAALKADSIPERALLRAEEVDVFALSAAVDAEVASVLNRPKFARSIPLQRRNQFLRILRCPQEFVLKPDVGESRNCEVVWRKGAKLAVRFV